MRDTVERMLPLYEAKMIHHYDHRWATYEPDGTTRDVTLEEKQNPDFVAMPRYWVRESLVGDRLEGKGGRGWLLGWRNVCRSTDERTLVTSQLPPSAVGHSMPLAIGTDSALLQALWSCFIVDFVARQKMGGINMTFGFVMQFALPRPGVVLPWDGEAAATWLGARATRLQSPESWTTSDRADLRAEIDAAAFHLYGVERDDVDYIMETFPIVKRKDIAAHGEFRTKRMILEIYDQMADAIAGGTSYSSPFDETSGSVTS